MKWLLLTALLLSSLLTHAQVKISGKVASNRSKGVAGASITLKGTYDGATSDSLGHFSFTTSEKGDHVLEVTISGYRSEEQQVKIGEAPIRINISLKELVTELKAVTITAGSFEASDSKRTT